MISKIKLFAISATLIIGFLFNACSNKSKITAHQCPMQCQVDTAYSKEGKCPVCEMDLEGIEKIDSTKIKILNN